MAGHSSQAVLVVTSCDVSSTDGGIVQSLKSPLGTCQLDPYLGPVHAGCLNLYAGSLLGKARVGSSEFNQATKSSKFLGNTQACDDDWPIKLTNNCLHGSPGAELSWM